MCIQIYVRVYTCTCTFIEWLCCHEQPPQWLSTLFFPFSLTLTRKEISKHTKITVAQGQTFILKNQIHIMNHTMSTHNLPNGYTQ